MEVVRRIARILIRLVAKMMLCTTVAWLNYSDCVAHAMSKYNGRMIDASVSNAALEQTRETVSLGPFSTLMPSNWTGWQFVGVWWQFAKAMRVIVVRVMKANHCVALASNTLGDRQIDSVLPCKSELHAARCMRRKLWRRFC